MNTILANRIIIFRSLFLLLIIYSCSPNKRTEGGLLWKIKGNDIEGVSYLFGTDHGMNGDFLDSIPGFWDAFNSVGQFALESDFTKSKQLDSIRAINKYLPANITYPDLLDEKELAIFDSTLLLLGSRLSSKEMNLVPSKLIWDLQIGLTKIESRKWARKVPYLRIVPSRINIDSRLLKISKFRSYPIIELDTEVELEQLGLRDMSILFSSNKLQDQAKEMIQAIKKIQEDNLMDIAKMGMEAYYNQDLAKIEEWSTHPKRLADEKAKEIYHTMCTKRNSLWIDKIVSTIKKRQTFIMVGVAHLPGEYGVINLLREKGFTVSSIK